MTSLLLCFAALSASAQYTPITVTGFNEDVIAEGVGVGAISVTTNNISGDNKVLMANGFKPTPCVGTFTQYLPATSPYASPTITGLTFQMGNFAANNCLRLASINQVGTLTFTTPVSASTLYMVATGGSGSPQVNVTVNFTDLSSQAPLAVTILDWYQAVNVANNYVVQQVGRVTRDATSCPETNTGSPAGPNLYHYVIPILPANYSKQIASITVTGVNTDAAGPIAAIFGISAKAVCVAPTAQPTAIVNGAITTSSISGSFTAASPAPTGTGGYLVVRYPIGSAVTNPVNGTSYAANQSLGLGTVVSSAATTTFSAGGLNGSSTYSFYVYSYNSAADCGGPIYITSSPLTSDISTLACAGTMTGTIAIGPGLPNTIGGGFTSLTNALASVNTAGLAGNTIFELQTGYDGTSANETFPIVFPTNPCVGPTRTLTIRPASSVSGALTITSNNVGPTLNLNGLSYVTIDGRAGGTGSTKMLNIINTNAGGAAIQFINDAHHNTITYCDIQGQNSSSTSTALCGVIYFNSASATLLGGNDFNTISFCDVHATAGGTPAIAICSYGSTTNTGSWNDNNTITDCNIYDYYSATTASTGIKLEAGSNAFTINNNRLYQTVTRNFTTGATHRGFWITPTSSVTGPSAFIITNNSIGGNNALGTGTWTMTGAVTTSFWGMDINHGGVIPTSVQGNTISNISLTCSQTSTTDIFRGISTGSTGNVNIGTVTPNIIGAATGTGAITLSTTASLTNTWGIKLSSASASTDTINVYNNIIGGFTITSPTATNATHFYGIGVTTGSYVNIVGNTIGSVTTPLSINCSNPATAAQLVYGINIATGITALVSKIQNNTVANLNNGYISTSTGYTRGINVLSSASTTVTGNTVRDITSASTYTGSVATAALVGILVNNGNPATITGNTVHSLGMINTSTTAASYLEGMVIGTNGTAPTHLVANNYVHSLYYTAVNTNSFIVGMDFLGGSNIIVNNMIRLGIMPDGSDITTAQVMRGLYLNSTAATNVYHNSVYIGGAGVGAVLLKHSVAFYRAASSGAHDVRNNIFVNNRSNTTATTGGKHYQVFLNNTTTLNLNYNIYYGTGTDAVFGTSNNGGADVLNYSLGWVAGDVNSGIGNPQFIAPTGSASTGDLHIHATNPSVVEGAGTAIASVTTDFDGQPRGSNTPNDVGADAGNFAGINMIVDSTVVDQITASALIGVSNQAVVAIRMYAKNSGSALVLTNFGLNTSGTTSVADISNAKVFYTGSSNVYDTTNLYGTLAVIPSGAFTVAGNITLSPGLNYFWVSYAVKSTAVAGNFMDARLDAVTLSGSVSPNILFGGDPVGARKIKAALNGNYNIGVGQTYVTITEALADLKLLGVSGPVTFNLKDALYNTTSGEVFPITLGSYAGSSAINTVKFVPDALLASCRIESNNGTATIDLNGGQNFIIDGRPGSTGVFVSGTNLQIVNTGTTAPAVRFINEAYKNTIRYVDLKGSTTVATATAGAGVVNFGTTTGVNGNDSNIIQFCDIHQEATALPLIGVSSIGSATTVATNNDGNSIENCNIYDFFNPALSSAGIYIGLNNGGWKIANNRVYQTATRTCTNTSTHRAFWITPNTGSLTSASGFDISNNFIGGNSAAGTGTYTMDGAFAYQFYIMDVQVGVGAPTSMQGNTVTNMSITNSGASFYGFNLNNGNINFGTTTGNLFGSTTTNGAVTFITNTNAGAILPFRTGGGAILVLKNNIASGINVAGSSATVASSFFGMNLSGGTTVIADNNTIGSLTLPNSITVANNTTTTASVLLGIISNPGAITSHTIINNTVANLTNNYSGAATVTSVRAIHVAPTGAGVYTVDNNTVKNISNASTSVGTGTNVSTVGIIVGTTAATTVSVTNNKVHSFTLTGTSTTSAVQASGIYYAGPTTGTSHLIGRNLVHSISLTAVNPAAIINGIEIGSGNVITANNMIRLGIDSTGTSVANSNTIRGIVKGSGNSGVYFNTVYIGGTGVGADYNRTYAFQRTTVGVDTVRNNIFENQRMNAGLGAGHFAVALNNNTTLNMNANILRADSIGVYNGTGQQTMVNWKGASGVDASSIEGVAGLVNPTGDKTTLDLHISGTTPAEAAGMPVNGIGTDVDFDGQVRNSLTPIDIGADAGNFTPLDLAAPVITYTALTSTTATTNRTISATITDVTGVYFAGTLRPRIYYKKMAAGTYASSQGVLVSGTKTNSNWDFTIDGASVGGILGGDSVYYYIIAQDSTVSNNIGSNPGGVSASNVNTITTHPVTPFAYRIIPFVSGTYTVGTSMVSTYPTLTSAINSIKNSEFNGPVVLELVDPLYTATTETFPIVISTAPGMSATNTLTIRPAAGVTAIIRDSITNAILDLNGIRYLILDGRQGGTGTPNSLSIVNRSISNVVYGSTTIPNNIPNAVRFINDAAYNTLKYINMLGANGTNESGVIFFSIGQVIGNSYNTIDNCNIGDVPGVAKPFTIFLGQGSVDAIGKYNRNNVITNNNIYNFYSPTGESNGFKVSKGNTAWTIKGNSFYQTDVLNGTGGTQYIMNLNRRVLPPSHLDDAAAANSLDSMVIADNIIGGSGPNASGTAWTYTGTGPNFSGIYGEFGKNSTAQISRNTFTNFDMTQNNSGNRWIAINLYNGLANIDSNTIGSMNTLNAIVFTSTVGGAGLMGINTNLSSVTTPAGIIGMSGNKMGGITINGGAAVSMTFAGINIANTATNLHTYSIRNNTIGSGLAGNIIITGASSSATAQTMVGVVSTSNGANTNIRNNTIQNMVNTYTGTGTGYTQGISIGAGVDSITGNTVSNLSIASPQIASPSVVGIQCFPATANNLVSKNVIRNLVNTNAGAANVKVLGINTSGITSSEVSANTVYGLVVASTGGDIQGISQNGSASHLTANNMVSLGLDTNGAAMTNGATITGIYKNSTGSMSAVHNTVKIQGSGVGTDLGTTYAYRRSASGTDSLLNNILINNRTNATTTGGGHYAVGLNNNASLTANYNIMNVAAAPGDTMVIANAIPYLTFAGWQTFSGMDAQSKDTAITFVSAIDLHLDATLNGVLTLKGIAIPKVTTDIDGQLRTVTPYIGADENPAFPLPVQLVSFQATTNGTDVTVYWRTASEINNAGYEVLRSVDGKQFEAIGFVKGKGNTSLSTNYSLNDTKAFEVASASTLYYRLKQVDANGKYVYSNTISVSRNAAKTQTLAVSPNPFRSAVTVSFTAVQNEQATIQVIDIQGKVVTNFSEAIFKGANTINLDGMSGLKAGVYFVKLTTSNETVVSKMIKE